MENKIGYAYISLEDYKELIEDNVTLKQINDDLSNQLDKIEAEYEIIEKTISDEIYNNERYMIKGYDGPGEYYHNQLVSAFQKRGYVSLDKINELISSLIKRYKEEQEESKECDHE